MPGMKNPALPALRRNGPPLILLLFGGLIGATLLISWAAVRHPTTAAFHQGDYFPMARCLEIRSADSFRVEYKNQEVTVRLIGVDAPAAVPDRLPGARKAAREEDIARQVLQGWVYRKQMVLKFPDDQAGFESDGRLPAYAELYGIDVGGKLIREGQARASTEEHPRAAQYRAYEEEAQAAQHGLWRE